MNQEIIEKENPKFIVEVEDFSLVDIAAQIIKNYCKNLSDTECEHCKFRDDFGECMFVNGLPLQWDAKLIKIKR